MYEQRQDFMIVALTGITGSGCSDFAKLMATPFDEWENQCKIRKAVDVDIYQRSNEKLGVVFSREYRTCYSVCKSQYKEKFHIIQYKDVLLLSTLLELSRKAGSYDETLSLLSHMIEGKFHHSYSDNGDVVKYEINSEFSVETLKNIGYSEELHKRSKRTDRNNREDLWNLYDSQIFKDFCHNLYEEMKQRDYYATNFFVHRLACSIRATGGCETTFAENQKSDTSHLFYVVELITSLIKGFHRLYANEPRRFVIDSVRNSMEIMYLRERFSAFYMIALHNDGHEEEKLKEKVQRYVGNEKRVNEVCKNIIHLSDEEKSMKDFENGLFYAPDLSRCVTESEIHIAYKEVNDLKISEANVQNKDAFTFFSYGEQWMKLYALILRPGLITPTRDERCMSIAYVAKFNSGCISRQVGCTIVDSENAVQAVGWNDPPASQLPCNLRYVDELINTKKSDSDKKKNELYSIFSKFELTDTTKYETTDKDGKKIYHGEGFCNCMDLDLNRKSFQMIQHQGLPYPYCFRTKYNMFKGNKDQVNTRALHAEENAMLRIAHRGGIGLDGGTMYVTASPCILCSKKAYQIGIRDIVYLDPYTDIAPDLILNCGFNIPTLRPFRGAIGETFYKLYRPFLPYKDELAIYEKFYK